MNGKVWMTASFLLLFGACGQGEVTPPLEIHEDWLFEVNYMQKNDVLTVTMSVLNQQNKQGSLDFASGQLYELILTDEQKNEVYRFSEGRMFTMAIIEELFEPMESKVFEEVILLENMDAGTYTLHAKFMVMAVNQKEWKDKTTFQKELKVTVVE